MAVNVEKLLKTIESQVHATVQERYPGYRVRLSQAIGRLLQAEQAWRRDRTPVNPEYLRECREVGQAIVAEENGE